MDRTIAEPQQPKGLRLNLPRRTILFAVLSVLVLLIAGMVLLASQWPFTQAKVVADLQAATQSQVIIRNFHQTFFPHPGCVAQDVSFSRQGLNLPPMTVKVLTVAGSYAGLLSRRIPLVRAAGVHAVIPPLTGTNRSLLRPRGTANAKIAQLVVQDAVLEFLSGTAASGPGLTFQVHEFTLNNPGAEQVMSFAGKLHNPIPAGEIETHGQLGPWKGDDPMATNISGVYQLANADLSVIHGLGGRLSSQGKYQGPLKQMSAQGSAKIPDFVVDNGHSFPLSAQFSANIDAENGDVDLQHATIELGNGARTELDAHGSIAGRPGKSGKTASLDLQVARGRIGDLLLLLTHSPQASMTGAFSFQGHATLQSARRSFFDALLLQGTFQIAEGKFTNQQTQGNIEALSEQAEGNPKGVADKIVSTINGQGALQNGVMTFSEIAVVVPGAKAKLRGSYNIPSKAIDLRGTAYGDATLAHSTTGMKSFLLKIIGPYLKKNHRGGSVVPFTIKGKYPHPTYKTDPI